MRAPLLFIFLAGILLAACKTPPLSKRVRGPWLIDHYDEYAAGRSTGHLYDRAGHITFNKGGSGAKTISAKMPTGRLASPRTFRYDVSNADSLVKILDAASGDEVERWLVTKNYGTYMEWVSVTPTRDTVRTMYLMKVWPAK